MYDVSGLAFYPITFPMMVGPGTIAMLIIYAGHAKGASDLIVLGGSVAAILLSNHLSIGLLMRTFWGAGQGVS